MLLHHRKMHCITRREALVGEHNLFGTFDSSPVNREDVIHCVQKRVESRLDVVAAMNGDVAM